MRILLRTVLALVILIFVAGVAAYLDGRRMPVDHSTTVTGVINAPPDRVFGLITDVADAPKWRKALKSVQVLPLDNGRDHWIEDLGHGVKMDFVAISTQPLSPAGTATRVVRLTDPQYGGDWTYDISPGPTPDQTSISITEAGYIHPPLYRFMMHRVFGMQKNLNQYMSDLRNAVR